MKKRCLTENIEYLISNYIRKTVKKINFTQLLPDYFSINWLMFPQGHRANQGTTGPTQTGEGSSPLLKS